MASTYSPSLRLELMGTGDQSGTWGVTTNTNLGTLLEQSITGYLSKAMADTDQTLTSLDGASDEARNMVVEVTGALTGTKNVVVPTAEKLYLAKNSTTGGFAVTFKTSAGTGVAVAAGTAQWVYCDGTNVVQGLSGTMAPQAASAVAITGGTIAGLTTLTMASGAATPATNDAAALGTSSLMWSDLFLASGGVVNWNNGDVLITHSANTLAFTGASSGYTHDAAVLPSANDAAALGSATVSWADLFLASGGVINWNNGDVRITHSANLLAFSGATSGYTFDVPIAAGSGGTGLSSPGTSGNVLTSNGTAWVSSAPVSGGMTLLGTLTTTSGTTQSLTGIASGYRQLYCEFDGVSFNSGAGAIQVALSSTNGAAYGTARTTSASIGVGADTLSGFIIIGNVSSTIADAKTALCAVAMNGAAPTVFAASPPTNTAAVVDAVRFTSSAGNAFDAGTIRVYGVK